MAEFALKWEVRNLKEKKEHLQNSYLEAKDKKGMKRFSENVVKYLKNTNIIFSIKESEKKTTLVGLDLNQYAKDNLHAEVNKYTANFEIVKYHIYKKRNRRDVFVDYRYFSDHFLCRLIQERKPLNGLNDLVNDLKSFYNASSVLSYHHGDEKYLENSLTEDYDSIPANDHKIYVDNLGVIPLRKISQERKVRFKTIITPEKMEEHHLKHYRRIKGTGKAVLI